MMRHDISVNVWESKRAVITKLYKDEEWPVKHVIKVIQTETFRPSEAQLRARLKKWRVTKPSRKKYCSGKAALAQTQGNGKLSASFGLTEALDGGSSLAKPTSKAFGSMTSTPSPDIPTSTAVLELLGTPDHHLDSLNSALDDYLRASCLLPTPGELPSPFSTTSTLAARDGSSDTSTMSNPGQDVGYNDPLHPTRIETDKQHCSIEGTDFSATQHTCLSSGHGRMGSIIPSVNSYNDGSAEATLTPGNLTTAEGGVEEWTSSYGPEAWWLPQVSPFEQYRTGIALCKHAIPRLTQRDRCRLGFYTGKPHEQHGSTKLSLDCCAAIPPSLSQAHATGVAALRPCLACLDFPVF
ncbi:hypothetical protein BJX63DRAFT_415735 [Aspergillus granulosus]|uniref:Clr5 domain-containing protein n=1 Tax=Aspergillus granulosus TaxID=176169 RepID=A0ABR4GSX5_9EURO